MNNEEIIEFCLDGINSLRGCHRVVDIDRTVMLWNMMEEVKK